MSFSLCRVIPENPHVHDADLQRDCDVASTLLMKIMSDDSTLSPIAAYAELHRRIAPVCVFQWDRMKLQQK
jgi:hypothetical protein